MTFQFPTTVSFFARMSFLLIGRSSKLLYYSVVTYYIVLCCVVLYCVMSYYIILYYIVLCCNVLYCIVSYRIVLYCIVFYYTIGTQKRPITPIDEYKYPALAYTQPVNSVFRAL